MNVSDIHNVTFDRVMRGYRPEEVDAYLDKVAAELERLQGDLEHARKDKEDAEKKMYILAEKVDQYRNDEETLKTALLNAQRMGESVIHEARQQAETILYEATNKANLARDTAIQQVAEEQYLLAQLKTEVARFKGDILNLYKQHIESLSLLPGEEKKKPTEDAPEDGEGKEAPEEASVPEEPAEASPSAAPAEAAQGSEDPDASINDYETIEFERD